MRLEFVEIANFRKLLSTRIGFSPEKTVFVGANNSGKTSAMVALRYFLLARERPTSFSLNDFTISYWPSIDTLGETWEVAEAAGEQLPDPFWEPILPVCDIWLHVEDDEIHYVQKILPTLDWEGGLIGVRLRYEPKNQLALQKDYLSARSDVMAIQRTVHGLAEGEAGEGKPQYPDVQLWPTNLTDFLRRRMGSTFEVKAYVLDPKKLEKPGCGLAQLQPLPDRSEPIDSDPLKGLIRIDEISAQRGFGTAESARGVDRDNVQVMTSATTRKLSDQLRQYYNKHLDPSEHPEAKDMEALKAIAYAEEAFDSRLEEAFSEALKEVRGLGYPGVTDPNLRISTRLKPIDGLNHDAAVQYVIQTMDDGTTADLRLPEDSNGLGYQNLISMVFRLMSFRDAWMRVGKAGVRTSSSADVLIPPLHIVLIEEPEAHLHTQVQQVFIRKAYEILRRHSELEGASKFTTQLVVSTHSSHLALECEFESLRYFRRMPSHDGSVPTSRVVNLGTVFGRDDDTKRFVTRYLKVTHCDLFFADAAVLIEGPAERILVPHLVREHAEFQSLTERYVTWLEIGGSHAHRLRPLIEQLCLPTLIITDIDAMDVAGKSTPPKRGCNQKTRNATLKSWCPVAAELDELLDKAEEQKAKSYAEQEFSIRVAYQHPLDVTFKGAAGEALPYTLEDALVYQNIALFTDLAGTGLIARIRKAIADSSTVEALGQALFEALKDDGKAEFALDLLEIPDAKTLLPPLYMADGLRWLSQQLREEERDLLLAVPAATESGDVE